MNQQEILYLPMEDDREERRELEFLRACAMRRVEAQRAEAKVEAVEAENRAMKDRARKAAKAKRNREARKHQRNIGYLIGASVGVLMVLAWIFTEDTGATALPLLLGGILMGRLK